MKSRGSGWCCSETAARRSAAAQPSVRRQSVARSSGASAMPSASNRAPASSSEKARSAARISVRLPSRRRRPSPIGGSARVTITSRSAGGGKRTSRSRSSWTASMTSWKSSSTRTTGCSRRRRARRRAPAAPGPSSSARAGSPRAPRPRRRPSPRASASRTARQKRRRSASSASSDSQATGPGARSCGDPRAQQRALAGAGRRGHQRQRALHAVRRARSSSRGRATAAFGPRGTENFVASSASDAFRLGMARPSSLVPSRSIQSIDQSTQPAASPLRAAPRRVGGSHGPT